MRAIYFVIVTTSLAAIMWGGGCGGGTASNNPPNVAGTYDRGSTDCPDNFDQTIIVVQTGDNIIFQATTPGFVDFTGTIDNDGAFTASSSFAHCTGQFVDGVGTAVCNSSGLTCNVSYNLR